MKRHIRHFKTFFLVLTALLALVNIYQLVFKSDKALEDNMDFRIYYLSAKLYQQREIIYDDSLIRQEWKNLVTAEHVVSHSEPGYPNSVVVYPPGFIPLYLPFSFMSWHTARLVFLFVAVCILLLCAFMLYRLQKHREPGFISIVLLVFAFKGTRYALITGQPMLLCFGLCMASLYLFRHNRKIPAGILLGLASFKFTFILPLAFWFLLQKQWRLCFTAVASSLLINLFIWWQYDFNPELTSAFTAHINTLWQFAHSYGEINSLNANTTELSTMLKYQIDINPQLLKNGSFVCYAGAYLFAAYLMLKQRAPAYFILVLLYLSDFCFGHHLVYDCLALLLLLPCLSYVSFKHRMILLLLLLPLLLPINQLFQALGYTGLMTITPLFVFSLYLYWLWLTVSFRKLPHHAPQS